MATEFDEYDYLEKSATAAAPAGDASGDRRSSGRDPRHHENGYGDGKEREKEEKEKEKEAKEKEKEKQRHRRSGSRCRSHRERDREEERERRRERERRQEREVEERREHEEDRRRRSGSSGSRRHEREEVEREYERGRSRDRAIRERELERDARDGRKYREKKESEPEVDMERDQRTVFAFQMPLRASEKDVYEFFSRAGKVRDVRLIMDRNSRRSKGVGYIEFYDAMSVPMAIALTDQLLHGQPVKVKPSEAEKNLVPPTSTVTGTVAARKIYVGNLDCNITEDMLHQVFESFGPVEVVQLPREAETGHCKGYGFIQFAQEEHAKAAQTLNEKVQIAGRYIKVSSVTDHAGVSISATKPADLDDDEGGGLSLNAHARAVLMQKLDRTGTASSIVGSLGVPVLNGAIANQQVVTMAIPGKTTIPSVPLASPLTEPIGQPSECILLKNMFDPNTEIDPDFGLDIKEEVEDECSKFGQVKHIYLDKNSKGHVYMLFDSVASASNCQRAMHGRWYASRCIAALYMPTQEYAAKFPDTS